MDKGMGSVLKNGFGILNFAEAPNLFRPRGVYIGGRGGWWLVPSSREVIRILPKQQLKKFVK